MTTTRIASALHSEYEQLQHEIQSFVNHPYLITDRNVNQSATNPIAAILKANITAKQKLALLSTRNTYEYHPYIGSSRTKLNQTFGMQWVKKDNPVETYLAALETLLTDSISPQEIFDLLKIQDRTGQTLANYFIYIDRCEDQTKVYLAFLEKLHQAGISTEKIKELMQLKGCSSSELEAGGVRYETWFTLYQRGGFNALYYLLKKDFLPKEAYSPLRQTLAEQFTESVSTGQPFIFDFILALPDSDEKFSVIESALFKKDSSFGKLLQPLLRSTNKHLVIIKQKLEEELQKKPILNDNNNGMSPLYINLQQSITSLQSLDQQAITTILEQISTNQTLTDKDKLSLLLTRTDQGECFSLLCRGSLAHTTLLKKLLHNNMPPGKIFDAIYDKETKQSVANHLKNEEECVAYIQLLMDLIKNGMTPSSIMQHCLQDENKAYRLEKFTSPSIVYLLMKNYFYPAQQKEKFNESSTDIVNLFDYMLQLAKTDQEAKQFLIKGASKKTSRFGQSLHALGQTNSDEFNRINAAILAMRKLKDVHADYQFIGTFFEKDIPIEDIQNETWIELGEFKTSPTFK